MLFSTQHLIRFQVFSSGMHFWLIGLKDVFICTFSSLQNLYIGFEQIYLESTVSCQKTAYYRQIVSVWCMIQMFSCNFLTKATNFIWFNKNLWFSLSSLSLSTFLLSNCPYFTQRLCTQQRCKCYSPCKLICMLIARTVGSNRGSPYFFVLGPPSNFFLQLVLISWMITLSSCLIWQIISSILPQNEYGCLYAWTTLR